MAVNYSTYKNTIKDAMVQARDANSIDEALDIMAQAYADALELAVLQMEVNTTVITPNKINGTGNGTVQ